MHSFRVLCENHVSVIIPIPLIVVFKWQQKRVHTYHELTLEFIAELLLPLDVLGKKQQNSNSPIKKNVLPSSFVICVVEKFSAGPVRQWYTFVCMRLFIQNSGPGYLDFKTSSFAYDIKYIIDYKFKIIFTPYGSAPLRCKMNSFYYFYYYNVKEKIGYLKWINFRVDKISRNWPKYAKIAKINPREI